MSIKVVYNTRYGGFSISRACAERMAELGNEEAAFMISGSEYSFYGYLERTSRHDPILVQAVEELGDEASGSIANLAICEIEGGRYIIDEYDGMETVIEPKDIKWIEV